VHILQEQWNSFTADGITSLRDFQSNNDRDVTGRNTVHGFCLVRMHAENPVNPFTLFLCDIVYLVSGLDLARVHTDITEGTGLPVILDLEDESKRCAVGFTENRFFGFLLGVLGFCRRDFIGSGKIIHYGIDKRLNSEISSRRTAKKGHIPAGKNRLPDFPVNEVSGNLCAFKNEIGQFIRFRGNRVEEFLTPGFGIRKPFGSNRGLNHFYTGGIRVPADFFHDNQINNAFKVTPLPDRDLERNGWYGKFLVDVFHYYVEIRTDTIHLVDETDAGNTVLLGLPPYGLCLGLNPANCAEHGDSAIKHPQGPFNLRGKIHVTGCINNVYLILSPPGSGCRTLDGNTPFLFLGHPVHGCFAVIYFTNTVYFLGIKQYPFGSRGLSRVDVGHNTDVSHLLKHE